jgi:hypothetical protein
MEQFDPIPETAHEALSLWDAGEAVFTAEMGGIGPGYEQCIQVFAFELIREFIDEPQLDERMTADADIFKREFESRTDAVMHGLTEPWTGLTGAQYGAAVNLAFCVLRRGYRAALRELPPDRLIQVRNNLYPVPKANKEVADGTA